MARKDHPLTRQDGVGLADLAAYPWLMPDYPPTHRSIINTAFLDAGLPPPVPALDVSTVVFFDALVRTTDMITVAPATLLSARSHGSDLVALRTSFKFPQEDVGIAYRENSTLLPGARVVIDKVRARCATLEGSALGGAPA